MQKTQTLNTLSVGKKSDRHAKSLKKFVLLNQNRQPQQKHSWKPLQTTQRITRATNQYNRQISFGLSYSNKKSILLTLNKEKSTPQKNKNQLVQQAQNLLKKSQEAQNILKSKLNLNSQRQNNKIQNLKNNFKTFAFDSEINKQKMESKFNKFVNTTAEFNKKVEVNLIEVKRINSFRLRESAKSLSQRDGHIDRLRTSENNLQNKRMIGIISAKRYGLRIRLKHVITSLCVCNKGSHQNMHNFQKNKKVNQLVSEMFLLPQQVDKTFYYFRMNKQPIASINDLPSYQNVVLALLSPIFNIESQNYIGLCEEGQKLSKHIKSTEQEINDEQDRIIQRQNTYTQRSKKSLTYVSPKKRNKYSKQNSQQQSDTNDDQETKYDHQLIPDINAYIDKIVQNPQLIKQQAIKSGINHNPSLKNKILELYKEKFDTQTGIQTGQNFRNPLLEDHSHYHKELKQKKLLSSISSLLTDYDFINNTHIAKRQSIYQMEQKAKEQKQSQLQQKINPNIINRNIQNTLKSKKSLIRQLDSKNSLLFEQNIPYIMNKYGINRYQIHNLFTIYKTLQKISAMKHVDSKNSKKVLSKGIDRGTFDEGMKRLDINPGDEVIKNICYFDDFISWQQFLKIVSIGLRKTLQEKLEAILSGIGGASNGLLNRKQISIMIGNSLTKIFDSDQAELREYFTNVAMRDLDTDNNGTVDVEQIKKKCLTVTKKKNQNQNVDLVTFLLLNS